MAIYQIDYDLRKQRNYDDLYKRIKSYPTWCHPLESTWVLSTTQSASQVRDYLAGAMDSDDGLLVTKLAGEAAWKNLNPQVSEYLKPLLEGQIA